MRCIFTGIARDGNGNIVPSSTITPFLYGTSTAVSIYTTLTGATAVNSVTAGDDGSFTFYVDRFDYNRDQCFDIQISKTGWTTWTWYNVDIRDVVLGTYTISADKTVTTNLGYIPEGVLYEVATGKTLTMSGSFDAGMYQIFSCVGTGAVTLSGKIKEVYPEWWGAKGDGVTDDHDALEKALNSVTSGRICGDLSKTYYIPTTISLTNKSNLLVENINWLGAGADDIASDSTIAGLYFTSSSQITIRKVYFNDIRGQFVLSFNTCDDVLVDNIKIDKFTYGAISITGNSNRIHIQNNHIKDCKSRTFNSGNGYGVQISTDSLGTGGVYPNYVWVESNIIEDIPNWDGVNAHGGTNIFVRNNRIKNCLTSVEMGLYYTSAAASKLTDIVVDGNIITGAESDQGSAAAREAGISIIGNATNSIVAERIKIINNTVKECGKNKVHTRGGIYSSWSTALTVIGNTVEGNGYYGIYWADNVSDYVIQGNIIKNNNTLGVYLGFTYAHDGLVTNNRIFDDGTGDYTQSYGFNIGSPGGHNIYEYNNQIDCPNGRYRTADVEFNAEYHAATAPPYGVWKQGEMVKNSAVASGGDLGWVCINRVDTTIRVEAAAAAVDIDVVDTTGMLAGDNVTILLDNGGYLFTKIDTVVDGDTIKVSNAIPAGKKAEVGAGFYTARFEANAL